MKLELSEDEYIQTLSVLSEIWELLKEREKEKRDALSRAIDSGLMAMMRSMAKPPKKPSIDVQSRPDVAEPNMTGTTVLSGTTSDSSTTIYVPPIEESSSAVVPLLRDAERKKKRRRSVTTIHRDLSRKGSKDTGRRHR